MARKARSTAKPKQEKPDSRLITVRGKFDYHWPGRNAVTCFRDPGEYRVKNEVADFAVKKGYASEGRSGEKPSGKAADAGTVAPMGDEDAAGDDRAADRPPVDSDAG